MSGFILICVTLLACLFNSTASAQGYGASPPLPGEQPYDRVLRIFAETSPDIGQPLPDLTCYDAQGQQFELRSLKGHHTVLVFGCLT